MVVLLLFAVGVAGAAAYQVVQVEAELAIGSEEASDALDVARGGLQRYLAESLGPPDTAVYALGRGTATVIPRRMAALDAETDLYLLRSEGSVSDPRYPDSPARRVASQYAYLHKAPVEVDAALMAAYNNIQITGESYPTEVNGDDASTVAQCPQGGGAPIIGVGNTGAPPVVSAGGVLAGAPAHADLGNSVAVRDSAEVRWSVLQNAQQPVGIWDGTMPDFGSLPSDSFPVVRMAGNYTGSTIYGRGVLIVPGTFSIGGFGTFHWEGIILAGSLGDLSGTYWSTVTGALVAGLDGGGITSVTLQNTAIKFDRCHVIAANRNIAYLEPLDATWWEGL